MIDGLCLTVVPLMYCAQMGAGSLSAVVNWLGSRLWQATSYAIWSKHVALFNPNVVSAHRVNMLWD